MINKNLGHLPGHKIKSRQEYIRYQQFNRRHWGDRMAGSDADDARQYLQHYITTAASLAHHGLHGKLKIRSLDLEDDLSSLPVEHLTSLISLVEYQLLIRNVSGCDLVTILDSAKCERLKIESQHLGTEETQALVQAMESGVPYLLLGGGGGDKAGEMTLDIEALVKYSGQGKCGLVGIPTWYRYREQLRSWAKQRNWIFHCNNSIVMCRNDE